MKGRWTAVALTLGMAAAPSMVVTAQDHAVPRGGGSGGGSSSAGDRHSGGGGSSSSSSGGGSSSSSSSSSSSGSDSGNAVPRSDAERRHPRPGTGTGGYHGGSQYYYSPYYYGSQYYYNAYDPFFYGYYGYSPFYYSGSYGYAPYYYRGRNSDSGSLRVIVEPAQARVYVDGYYAGVVDDFDGIFQRLSVPPGGHEISVKLDGYRTHNFRVYVPSGETVKIHHVMERGAGPATDEVIGEAEYRRDEERQREMERQREAERYEERDAPDPRDEDRPGRDDPAREDERDGAEAGTVRLDIRPSDASVYVDGEFRGAGRRAETLRLAPGRHRIEVVRPGYRTVEREIDVRPGDNERVEIQLDR